MAGGSSCQFYQRSADIFLGVPFNIASYALLTMMVAQVCGYELGDFVWTGGDCHLYVNHLEQTHRSLPRAPRRCRLMRINPDVKGSSPSRSTTLSSKATTCTPHFRNRWPCEHFRPAARRKCSLLPWEDAAQRQEGRPVSKPVLALIAAHARDRVIGIDNRMPWHLPEDMKFFRGPPAASRSSWPQDLGNPCPTPSAPARAGGTS